MVDRRILRKQGESAAGTEGERKGTQGSAEVAEVEEVEEVADFTSDELREFLEADTADELADPEFKERLREKLWDLVRRRYGSEPEDTH